MSISNYKEKQNDYPVMKKIVSFLSAGLVDYSDVDDGKYLLRKEAIEKMLPTLEGRPLVIGHQKIDPEHLDDVAVGYITKGYWNPETGSFDCDVLECILLDLLPFSGSYLELLNDCALLFWRHSP